MKTIKLKEIAVYNKDSMPRYLTLKYNQVAKVIFNDKEVYWIAEHNALGGVCDCCKNMDILKANTIIIYEQI